MIVRDILHVSSPGTRPPWRTPQHKPMTQDETAALMLALAQDGEPLRYRTVQRVLGGEPWGVLNSLKVQGALDHPGYNDWRITEKGRIAAALAMHKDRTLAAAFSDEEPKT